MVELKETLQEAKTIVLANMDDYKIYLNKYINESRISAQALDYSRYLHDCMSGIFYDSLNSALWKDWHQIDRMTLLDRFYKILENVDAGEVKSGLNLRTPAYACIVITNAVSGIPLTSSQISALSALDEKIKGYFAITRRELKAEFDQK